MALVNQTINAVSLQNGYASITVGSETFTYPADGFRDVFRGRALSQELMLIQMLLNLVTLGTDLTSATAIRTALLGMTIKVAT